ncbi:MAG: hypothetical protein EP335_00415 [Alphaproteobacteria bacterium]|nr:MAG: hypothetical protein EP335_00415 [Alphaproteobacteria bacterium]
MQIELLNQLEEHVRNRAYGEARPVLMKIFEAVEAGTSTFGGQISLAAIAESEATRLASAITQLLTDPDHQMEGAMFLEFNRFKRAISQVFEVSGYRGTWHLYGMTGKDDGKGGRAFKRSELLKMFSGLSINAMNDTLYSLLLKLEPRHMLPIVIGMLSEQLIYSSKAEEIRGRLLADGHLWDKADPHPYTLLSIGPAYMGCSYADAPHKHQIKKSFNKVVRRWLDTQGVKDTVLPAKRELKDKPKAVIFAEFYNAAHAMHRCYGPSIRSMMEHFDTTLVLVDTEANAELKSLAHTVETIKFQHTKAGELIKKLQSYKPDLLYFPSVGMRLSSIIASTVRIAPIQVLTFGHPATTYSDAMDYVVLADKQLGSDTTVSEKVMLRPSKPRFTHRADAENIKPDIRVAPDVVRIAVPAWSRKVNPQFLNACRQIRDAAKTPVEFWFFPNAVGALHQAILRRYAVVMPDAKVLPRKNYNDYIRDLNACDIFLSTFPFGATNGIVDAARQGLPIVNMTGDEVHAANDSHHAEKLAQPAWLTTRSTQEFVDAVVRLVDDSALREQISRDILAGDPDKAFFVEDDENASEFSTLMDFVYRNHEAIQASPRKTWHHDAIVAGTAFDDPAPAPVADATKAANPIPMKRPPVKTPPAHKGRKKAKA